MQKCRVVCGVRRCIAQEGEKGSLLGSTESIGVISVEATEQEQEGIKEGFAMALDVVVSIKKERI